MVYTCTAARTTAVVSSPINPYSSTLLPNLLLFALAPTTANLSAARKFFTSVFIYSGVFDVLCTKVRCLRFHILLYSMYNIRALRDVTQDRGATPGSGGYAAVSQALLYISIQYLHTGTRHIFFFYSVYEYRVQRDSSAYDTGTVHTNYCCIAELVVQQQWEVTFFFPLPLQEKNKMKIK